MKKLAVCSVLAFASVAFLSAFAQLPVDAKMVDGLNDCVAMTWEKGATDVEHLFLKNNCKAAAHVYYFSTGPDSGGTYLKPGEQENTHLVHDKITTNGGVAIYACPTNSVPMTDDGKFAANKKKASLSVARWISDRAAG